MCKKYAIGNESHKHVSEGSWPESFVFVLLALKQTCNSYNSTIEARQKLSRQNVGNTNTNSNKLT